MGRGVEVEVEVERAREWQGRVSTSCSDTAVVARAWIRTSATDDYCTMSRLRAECRPLTKGASDARGRARSATRRRARDAALAPARWTTNVCARGARPGAGRFAPRDASPRATRHPAPASSRSPATRRPALIRPLPPPRRPRSHPPPAAGRVPPREGTPSRGIGRGGRREAPRAAPSRPPRASPRVVEERRRRSRPPRGVRRRVAAAAPRAPRAPRDERRRRARGRHLLRPRHARGACDRAPREGGASGGEREPPRGRRAPRGPRRRPRARSSRPRERIRAASTPEKKREKRRRLGIDRSERPRRRERKHAAETGRGPSPLRAPGLGRTPPGGGRRPRGGRVVGSVCGVRRLLGRRRATNFYKEAGAEEGDARRREGDLGAAAIAAMERAEVASSDAAMAVSGDAAPPRFFGDECAEDPLDAWLAGAVAATPSLFSPRTLDSAASRPGAPKDLGDSPFDRRSEAVKGSVEGVEVGRGEGARRSERRERGRATKRNARGDSRNARGD